MTRRVNPGDTPRGDGCERGSCANRDASAFCAKGLLMANLPDLLTSDKKEQVVDDCCSLIDSEVKDKGGISGLAIKAGYGAVKGVKPGFVRTVVSDLLPEFASALD